MTKPREKNREELQAEVVSSIGPVDKVIYKPRFHAIIPARRDRR